MLERARSGQSLVEFVVVLPILALLLIAMLHFGIVIWTMIQVNAATREGAIYGSYHPQDDAGMSNTVRACLPAYIDANGPTVSVSVTGEGTRGPGSRLRVVCTYNIGAGGGVLPGGQLMSGPDMIVGDISTPVLVGTVTP